jgi:hypothetical protein
MVRMLSLLGKTFQIFQPRIQVLGLEVLMKDDSARSHKCLKSAALRLRSYGKETLRHSTQDMSPVSRTYTSIELAICIIKTLQAHGDMQASSHCRLVINQPDTIPDGSVNFSDQSCLPHDARPIHATCGLRTSTAVAFTHPPSPSRLERIRTTRED